MTKKEKTQKTELREEGKRTGLVYYIVETRQETEQ